MEIYGRNDALSHDWQSETIRAVARPSDPDKFTAVYETLQTIVRYCLQENPEHMPATCLTREEEKARGQAGTSLDQDDFVLYTQQQAKLISYSLKEVRPIIFTSRTYTTFMESGL